MEPRTEPVHYSPDPCGRVVQGFNEEVPDVSHETSEAEETVSLCMFTPRLPLMKAQNVHLFTSTKGSCH